jgi:transcriptional regulator with XRE-family HTH domain
MSFHSRLQEALIEIGISQSQLARQIGISRGTVSLWLSGSTQLPESQNLTRAAMILGITPHWLATGTGPKKIALSPEEETLLSYFRKSDERGKASILHAAQAEMKYAVKNLEE